MTEILCEKHPPTSPLTKGGQGGLDGLEVLRRAGNPFRNYFARNPDDEVCARFHVPALYARERDMLLRVVDLYRADPATHSEIVPVLGNKGAGKTHLLHSIKHGADGTWQMLVTPGTYQKDSEFLEYLLFQVIDTLLGGGKQRGRRPMDFVGEEVGRRLLHRAVSGATREELLDLFPTPGLGRWTRRLGLGSGHTQERAQVLLEALARCGPSGGFTSLRRICAECQLECERACDLVCKFIERTEARNTAGLMRRHISQGFIRAVLLGDESELANFLTYGFAELDFKVQPSRQDLVLALLKVLMGTFVELRIPVVVAFDQLEDLLLARRSDNSHRIAEAFFAGIVQTMHQIDGVCFLVFAERGLWNRFVPSLDGYIQDRISNPIHLPGHGTVKALRLEAPPADLVRKVVEVRLRSALGELQGTPGFSPVFPFTDEQITRVARTEATLRDMLQQFRQLFDYLVYGEGQAEPESRPEPRANLREALQTADLPAGVKSVVIVETKAEPATAAPLAETWEQELTAAKENLSTDGALTGATRELQAGLGSLLQVCHEHGVKVGPWRLQHVVGELAFGEHPTYGVISIGHWVCKDGQPWKVGAGLFLARGPAKPKDLEMKLSSFELTPAVVDHLILLRPEDDLNLTGKSKTLWQECERRGRHVRLEAVALDNFAILYAFPRWLAAISDGLQPGQTLPNLADFLQERCEKLLEQVCMPVCP